MATKKDETASFVLRFTQKIFKTDQGEPQIQWRGNIRHVQGGDEKRFSEFDEAFGFVREKLAELTMQQMEDKSPEEQRGILAKSYDLWKRVAAETPKLVRESLKAPKKQVAQMQEQMAHVSDAINQRIEDTLGQKLEIDEFRGVSKADFKNMMQVIEMMSNEIQTLHKKVDTLSKKTK